MANGQIVTVGDLKKYLADVPDDLPVYEFNGLVGRGLEVRTGQVTQVKGRSVVVHYHPKHPGKAVWAVILGHRRLPNF